MRTNKCQNNNAIKADKGIKYQFRKRIIIKKAPQCGAGKNTLDDRVTPSKENPKT